MRVRRLQPAGQSNAWMPLRPVASRLRASKWEQFLRCWRPRACAERCVIDCSPRLMQNALPVRLSGRQTSAMCGQ
jgi:hypothetical protein